MSFDELNELKAGKNRIDVNVSRAERASRTFARNCQIDSQRELAYLRRGGPMSFAAL